MVLHRKPTENRRKSERIKLSESLVVRFGTMGVVLIDISDRGAQIEHYERLKVREEKKLRMTIKRESVSVDARAVVSKVHRFATGDKGLTVFRTGLEFIDATEDDQQAIKQIIASARAQTLVEQVANAKGFAPPKGEMPIFSGGILTSNDVKISTGDKDGHLVPDKPIVRDIGFVRFYRRTGRWLKIWTMDPTQPDEGFTVSANEPADQID